MKSLEKIDVAFLPINQPFTMRPEEAADAARTFKPRIVYPYHQGSGDPNVVKSALADVKEIEVRVRPLP
jgi:L-ascorbate metabolism protein UlaG (beta-lactamase superfamily)